MAQAVFVPWNSFIIFTLHLKRQLWSECFVFALPYLKLKSIIIFLEMPNTNSTEINKTRVTLRNSESGTKSNAHRVTQIKTFRIQIDLSQSSNLA